MPIKKSGGRLQPSKEKKRGNKGIRQIEGVQIVQGGVKGVKVLPSGIRVEVLDTGDVGVEKRVSVRGRRPRYTGPLPGTRTVFSKAQVVEMYVKSPEFRQEMNKNHYIHVRGRLFPAKKEILGINRGEVTLRGAARKNPDDYCLRVEVTGVRKIEIVDGKKKSVVKRSFGQVFKPEKESSRKEELLTYLGANVTGGGGDDDDDNTVSFGSEIDRLRKQKKLTNEALAGLAEISTTSLRNIITGEEIRPNIRTVVSLCVALDLKAATAERMVYLSGYTLLSTPDELAYRFILDRCKEFTVPECNEMLTEIGLRALTSPLAGK